MIFLIFIYSVENASHFVPFYYICALASLLHFNNDNEYVYLNMSQSVTELHVNGHST